MITKEYAEGLSEVLAILDNTEIEYINKIPKKVINFFKENASKEYTPKFEPHVEIKDMNIKKETKHIPSVIYINYWAETKEEKEEFQKILNKNQKELNEEMNQKYNSDNLFKKKEQLEHNTNMSNENLQMITYKEKSLIRKIVEKIIAMFRKKRNM